MARTIIELPSSFVFSTEILIRITDINYGGHVGNDSILSLLHETRMQFLIKAGLDEMGTAGPGLIMRDVIIEFRKELFYGDHLVASVAALNFETASFDIVYKIERIKSDKTEIAIIAKTGMVCYDYARKKIAALTSGIISSLSLVEI
ncbi:MAG: acyl-CoA thioesterase [Chitinophagaceae bacterium]